MTFFASLLRRVFYGTKILAIEPNIIKNIIFGGVSSNSVILLTSSGSLTTKKSSMPTLALKINQQGVFTRSLNIRSSTYCYG